MNVLTENLAHKITDRIHRRHRRRLLQGKYLRRINTMVICPLMDHVAQAGAPFEDAHPRWAKRVMKALAQELERDIVSQLHETLYDKRPQRRMHTLTNRPMVYTICWHIMDRVKQEGAPFEYESENLAFATLAW